MRIKIIFAFLSFCLIQSTIAQRSFRVQSPSGVVVLNVQLDSDGSLSYMLDCKGKTAIKPSTLGMRFSSPEVALTNFNMLSVDSSSFDETWETVWGEEKRIRNNYRELILKVADKNKSAIAMNIIFRVYDDGLGFRYEFPKQAKLAHFVVANEDSRFAMSGDHDAFWIPGDFDTNEYTYYKSKLSGIDASGGGFAQEIHAKTFFDSSAVQTPLMMKTSDGLYINIHEAALSNYPAMNLILDKSKMSFVSALVPDAVGNKAYLQTPAKTPWRTIIVSDNAPTILASRTILNLNDPSVVTDPSFIYPQKYVGVWWEMHVGKSSWDYSGSQVGSQQATRVPHGANTANVKRYIDFAAKYGFKGVLVEGWNVGWEDWFGQWKEDVFDFVTPYPDFNVDELSAYAKSKDVKLIMHHETSASVTNYERWMDTAYRFMRKYGYDAVKTGYVGRIIPRGEHHDGQWMVKHYERVASKTSTNRLMVNMHESVRLTGMHRTYPNWVASEAARGNEFNAWSSGNPPDHETILPFTRLMGGPMDYTPGIFKIKMSSYDSTKKEQVHTTLAKQLALYVTMYSPLQMAADLPENYEAHTDALQFIRDVASDWDDTRILEAEPGDYIITVRKARNSNDWFLGAITDEVARKFTTILNFLDADKKYVAAIYRDADNAHWQKNPEAYTIEKFIVDSKSKLRLSLAAGGGTAISFKLANAEEIKSLKKYK
jgi:hypothetical protein